MNTFDTLSERFRLTGTSDAMADWIHHCRCENLFGVGAMIGSPYLEVFSHNFRFLTELYVCYFYTGQYEKSFDCSMRVAKLPLTQKRSRFTYSNSRFCIPYIKDRYTEYPTEIVKTIKDTDNGIVTFTITTCKRLDLFKQTMNSFLQACEDINLICRWICIDDNSSDNDKKQMQELYPFFEFVFKTPDQKGHAKSMNILRSMVKTPFFFHMEDDWKFFVKRPYITECLRVIEQNSMYGQCLVNINYAETEHDFDIIGGEFHSSDNTRFYVHDHQPDIEKFYSKYGRGRNSGYWPHYSLRPGLCRTIIYSTVGEFVPTSNHFEMEYAYRYMKNGFRTTFLENINAIHIGRLTSERFDDTKQNAYTLNNENQFVTSYRAFVVNLDRRPDRFTKFRATAPSTINFERYSAIDGKKLKSSLEMSNLFNFNDYNYRSGIVGCALSHIDLWIRLLEDPEYDTYLIVEDDVEFSNDFSSKLDTLNTNPNWDVLMLGHHLRTPSENAYDRNSNPVCQRWNTVRSFSESKGGTGGYLIRKGGAFGMLKFIQETSMTNAIDTMIQHACDTIDVFYCFPHLVYADCATPKNIDLIDTDIQRDYTSLRMPIEERLEEELRIFEMYMLPYQKTDETDFDSAVDVISVICLVSTNFKLPENGKHYFLDDTYCIYVPPCLENHQCFAQFRLLDGDKFSTSSIIRYT